MKDKLITVILTLVLVVTSLTIIPSATQYNLGKIWVLLIGGAILLILTLLNYKNLKLDKKDYLILIFAMLIYISTICSSNVKTSIIGDINRYEGMLTLYSYVIIYICAKKFFKIKNKENLLVIIHLLYILVGVLGILQYHTKLPTNRLFPIFNKGVCGTFGNTNFMGNFVSMGLPIFIINYMFKGKKISLITSFIVFFCLISCTARSGWVAFGAFCILLLVYLIENRKKEYVKRIIVLIVGFSIILTVIYLQPNSPLKTKISSMKEEFETGEENLGSGRIQIWKISIELIKKYPVLGVGTDNLQYGIANNLTETSLTYILNKKGIPDKAHNEYLQIAVTLGIPALVIYLVFICSILLPKIKHIFSNKYILYLGSVIICYLVQAFFNISTIGIAPLFWFALGLIDNKSLMSKKDMEDKI